MTAGWVQGVLEPAVIAMVIMTVALARKGWLAAGLAVAAAGAIELAAGLACGSAPWTAGGVGTLAASLVAFPAGRARRRREASRPQRAPARAGRPS